MTGCFDSSAPTGLESSHHTTRRLRAGLSSAARSAGWNAGKRRFLTFHL